MSPAIGDSRGSHRGDRGGWLRNATSLIWCYPSARVSSVGDKYILPGKDDHDRLRMISEIHDARTHALLKRAGLSAQRHFVEFGCGLGYITRWAAAKGAHSTGIDVNAEQVQVCQTLAQEAGLRHASFRVGSVYEPGIEPDTLDISYSRLMVHLNRPVEAMRAIREALTPGASSWLRSLAGATRINARLRISEQLLPLSA